MDSSQVGTEKNEHNTGNRPVKTVQGVGKGDVE